MGFLLGACDGRIFSGTAGINKRKSSTPAVLGARNRVNADVTVGHASIMSNQTFHVMAGLGPAIHALLAEGKTWMAGIKPAMTMKGLAQADRNALSFPNNCPSFDKSRVLQPW